MVGAPSSASLDWSSGWLHEFSAAIALPKSAGRESVPGGPSDAMLSFSRGNNERPCRGSVVEPSKAWWDFFFLNRNLWWDMKSDDKTD